MKKAFIKIFTLAFVVIASILITTSTINAFQNSDSNIVGTWHIWLNGIDVTWVIRGNGTCIFSIKDANGETRSIKETWYLGEGNIYEKNSNGQIAYGSISMPDYNHLIVTVIDNGNPQEVGQVRIYTRAKFFISFKGQQHCRGNHNSCTCPGYEKFSRSDWHCKYCWCPKDWHIF